MTLIVSTGLGGTVELPLVLPEGGHGSRVATFNPDAGDLELAKQTMRDRLPELCNAAIGFAIAGGRNAAAYVKFVADVFRLNQAAVSVQLLVAERLGVPLEQAKAAVDAVQGVPESLEGIEAMNCRFLAWVVRQYPERAEAIRAAIFGAAVEVGE